MVHQAFECEEYGAMACNNCQLNYTDDDRVFMAVKGFYDGKYFEITNRLAKEIAEKWNKKHMKSK